MQHAFQNWDYIWGHYKKQLYEDYDWIYYQML